MDAFIGEIRAFANTWYPAGWLPCNGDRVSIIEYQMLFSIIGPYYGPTDGQTYFTLPDLRGTAMVGAGQNPRGTLNLPLGQGTGTETTELTTAHMPLHAHTFNGAIGNDPTAQISSPENDGTSFLSNFAYKPTEDGSLTGTPGYIDQPVSPVLLNPGTIAPAGGNTQSAGVAHDNMAPYLAINYYICAEDGYYPPRP
jgi:microcystin-dependent protein